jgi:hypothetical protein
LDPPEVGYPKVAKALKDNGSAAFFWNASQNPGNDLFKAIDEVYDKLVPGLGNPEGILDIEWAKKTITSNFDSLDTFGEVTFRQYTCTDSFTSEQYHKMLKTYSHFRDLDEDLKLSLFESVIEVIDQHGGTISIPRLVALFFSPIRR